MDAGSPSRALPAQPPPSHECSAYSSIHTSIHNDSQDDCIPVLVDSDTEHSDGNDTDSEPDTDNKVGELYPAKIDCELDTDNNVGELYPPATTQSATSSPHSHMPKAYRHLGSIPLHFLPITTSKGKGNGRNGGKDDVRTDDDDDDDDADDDVDGEDDDTHDTHRNQYQGQKPGSRRSR